MSVKINSTERCRLCGYGSMTSFNWPFAKNPTSDSNINIFNWPYGKIHPSGYTSYVFEFIKKLKTGSLFKCKSCNEHWYLDENESFMNAIPKTRLELIKQWDASTIILNTEQLKILKEIGRTPPDIYGNGKQYHETPCKIITKNCEIFNFAIITQQRHAPFEKYRKYRLASEIQEIQSSPFALSLEVRVATTEAGELGMGFAPTVIEKPNGELVIFNWTQHFYDNRDCLAKDLKVANDYNDPRKLPIASKAPEITYFIADCEI